MQGYEQGVGKRHATKEVHFVCFSGSAEWWRVAREPRKVTGGLHGAGPAFVWAGFNAAMCVLSHSSVGRSSHSGRRGQTMFVLPSPTYTCGPELWEFSMLVRENPLEEHLEVSVLERVSILVEVPDPKCSKTQSF